MSFTSGVFPSALKIAKVVPVCKMDSKLDFSNYRPISLLSNLEKILEKIIEYLNTRYIRILEYLNSLTIINLSSLYNLVLDKIILQHIL